MRLLIVCTALAAFFSGCAEKKLTELLAVVTVDAALEKELAGVEYTLKAGPAGALEPVESNILCAPFPRTLALTPRDGDLSRIVELELRGLGIDGRELGRTQVRAGYRDGEVERLDLTLELCAGDCLVDRTGEDLPNFTGELPAPNTPEPELNILFPPQGALVYSRVLVTATTSAQTLTIDGAHINFQTCVHARADVGVEPGIVEIPVLATSGEETRSATVRVRALAEDLQAGPLDLVFSGGKAYGLMSQSIRAVDLAGGETETKLAWSVLDHDYFSLLASPDDGRLFALRADAILVFEPETGALDVLTELQKTPKQLAWDRAGHRLILAQQSGDMIELLAVDPRSGDSQLIFTWLAIGAATARDLEVHPDGARIYLADWGLLLQFELATGAVTDVLCDRNIVPGAAVTLDPDRNELLLIDTVTPSIVARSFADSSCRDVVAGPPQPAFSQPARIAYQNDKVWVYDSDYVALFELDRVNQTQKMIPRPSVGSGPVLAVGSSIEYSEARRELVLPLDFPPEIIGVNVHNGERRVLSSAANGLAGRFFDVTVRKDGQTAIAVTWSPPGLYEVELQTGAARFITAPPPMRELALSKNEDEVYLLLPPAQEIAAINIQSGAMRTIAKSSILAPYLNMALDAENDRLVVTGDPTGELLTVDLERGNIERLVRVDYESVFRGTPPTSIDIEPGGRRVFLKSGSEIIAVDVSTAELTTISGSSTAELSFLPDSFSADWRRGVLYSLDRSVNAIYAVDLASGTRVILSR